MADGMLSVSQSFVQSKKHHETVTESCSVYKRRWYILTIFSLIAGVQAAAWNTWGPITGSAEDVFGWSDGTIALLENWGPIAYIVSFLFFSWLMDVKGVTDDRGKFIYISPEELQTVAKFIKQRGRVTISELAESSNTLINLQTDKPHPESSPTAQVSA